MDKLVNVALNIAHNNGLLTYRLCNAEQYECFIGKRVKVALRSRLMTGVIINETNEQIDNIKIKDIIEVIDSIPVITKEQLALMSFCARYYFNSLGECVHLAVPRNEKAPRKEIRLTNEASTAFTLSLEQKDIVEKILTGTAQAFLLEGITGSGKTHVYIKVAEAMIKKEKSVLFLVPEISLTPQLVNRVESALNINALVIHSNITPSKKRDTIYALLSHKACVLIGARSAIFAPLKDLGLIVVDEEHDASLKQDESPRYHARDLAIWRAKNENALVILGSATPSLESIANVERGKLSHLRLHNRFLENRPLPEVTVIDLKTRGKDVDLRTQDKNLSEGQSMCILSRPLVLEMQATLAQGAQVLLFLNQRGYAKFGVCYKCGHVVLCPNCSVGLTYYQNRGSLLCHQCQYIEIAQTVCRNCTNDAVRFLGLGTERLEEEVRAVFPQQRIVRLDRDVVKSFRRLKDTLQAMHEQKADIMVGTQMIAKGHDFLNVGLVGVVCADMTLSMPDFRAAEKTFQLLTQVAGRAGRGNFLGKAIIQTFNPDHPSIVFAKDHNVRDFIHQELSLRKRFLKPPFSRAALIRCEHKDPNISESILDSTKKLLAKDTSLMILGPAPSPIERINQRFRFQCMAMSEGSNALHSALMRVSNDNELSIFIKKNRARFIIDVDPQNLC